MVRNVHTILGCRGCFTYTLVLYYMYYVCICLRLQGTQVFVTSAAEDLVAGSTLTFQECRTVKDVVAQVGSEGWFKYILFSMHIPYHTYCSHLLLRHLLVSCACTCIL